MISSIQFSEKSLNLLNLRQLSQDEIQQFSELLTEAKSQQATPKNTLLAMSADELKLIQKAHSLADPIKINSLSEEGASNLLSQPDNSDKVDLNNDGIVEVGAARSIIFPPVNAPDSVKLAWQSATAGMTDGDKLTLQLSVHIAVFGINSLSGRQKQQMIMALQQQKEAVFEQAQKRSVENEKRKSLLSNNINLLENLDEQKLKQLTL